MSAFFEDLPRWSMETDSTALVARGASLQVMCQYRDGRSEEVLRASELGNRPVTPKDLAAERERRLSRSTFSGSMREGMERAVADAEARAPEHHPFAARLRALEGGAFLLRETEVQADSARWTLFDRDGSVAGQLRLPANADVLGGDRQRLLLVMPDERDVPVIAWHRLAASR